MSESQKSPYYPLFLELSKGNWTVNFLEGKIDTFILLQVENIQRRYSIENIIPEGFASGYWKNSPSHLAIFSINQMKDKETLALYNYLSTMKTQEEPMEY